MSLKASDGLILSVGAGSIGMGDAALLADLHQRAFETPWDAAALSVLLDQPGVFAIRTADDTDTVSDSITGFILCRVVVDEAEILTLAVDPAARRGGLGRRLTEAAADMAAQSGAETLFLEVADDNLAARTLYERAGFLVTGRRRNYYARQDGAQVDALVLSLILSQRLPTG